ncbi:MAG: HYR domain-containing protein [Flavobacteriales bacterium]|nr:HYR domain-containing protein [Flavobacteriales bacterium]
MKNIYSFLFVFTAFASVSSAQQVTQTWSAPSSVTIDNVGNYGYSAPAVTFNQGQFTSGCRVSDVDVIINWAKTDGTCSAPTGGSSYHEETSFRIDGPTGNEVLAQPATWSGNATTNNVITTFNQGSTIPSGTPATGTYGPNNGNLDNYIGDVPFGNWNLRVGDNDIDDPVCLVSYSVRITTSTDTDSPVFTSAPSNFNVNTDPGNCTAVVTWPTPVATDQCSVTLSQTAGLPSGSAFPIGTSTVTYQAVDPYSHVTTHSFTVTVTDNQNPTVACPVNPSANAPSGNCAANVSFTTPTPSDNCPGATVAQIAGPTSGSSFPVGNTTVTFRATDAAGNTGDCSFQVEVLDIEDPAISCPANINTVSTNGSCGALVTYSTPVGTDNCSGVQTVLTAGYPTGLSFPSGTTTVTYLAIDASGNQNDCSFTVTVDPVPNGTLSLPPTSVCQGNPTDITFTFSSGSGPFNVSFTDGISVFTVNGVQSGDTYTIVPPTSVTYSYTSIQDATGCARTSGFLGTASVVVTPIPVVNFSGLDQVYCVSDADVTLTGNQNGGSFSGTGIAPLGTGTATFSPSGAGPTGPYDITYEFTDINGCTDSQVQQVSVDAQPVADAGAGGDECDLDFTFSAVPTVGVGTWTTVSGPGLPFFSDINSATSIVQVSAVGTYVFRWTEVNGECSDFDEVTVNFYQVPSPNPGFGGAECDLNFQLGATPSVGVGTWSAIGPGTATFTPDANDPNAVVDVDTYGTYSLIWTEDNNGCSNSASISVVFDQLAVSNAGSGGDECDLNFTFSAVPSVGTGVWTATGPGAVTYSSPNSPTATATVSNDGTYVFTWTETSGNCVSVDQVTVNFYQQPVANAGSGGDECDLDFALNAIASSGTGTWTSSDPGNTTFSNASSPTSTVSVSQYGTYDFTWTEVNGTCSDAATITVNFYEQPTANAGLGGDECDLDFTFTGVASVGVGLWTSVGPGTASFTNDLDATTDVTVSAYGTYTFTWNEINGTCSDAASVTVNFYEQPVADAGTGGDECDLNFLLVSTPSVGLGVWSITSGPGVATFNNAVSPVSLVTVDTYGSYEFTWTETNGSCSDASTVTVNFYQQPVADAGNGGNECDLDFVLSAVPSYGNGLWTSSGPGSASFLDDADPNTAVTVTQSGAYTFTWTETNGSCVDSDDVQVNLYDQPVADAGQGGDECDLNFTFSGVSSFGTGTWTYTGAGNAFFSNANSATGAVTVDTYGSYDFTWTEVNGICSDAATITVNFYQQPVANAGNGGSECDLDFNLNATASVGVGTWTFTGPGSATFSPDGNTPNAIVTVDATGQYTFTWTENNSGCSDSEDVIVVFNPLPVVSFSGLLPNYCIDQTSPVALTGSPAGGTFSGLGISGNSFVPSIAGVGTIFITYTYTDLNGCTDSETQAVDVNGLPVVSFTGLSMAYCEDDATSYTLTGVPAGGNFSGLGISGNDFVPVNAGAGIHTVTYTYSDPFGCTSFEDQSVTINELPVVSFTGLAASYCENASNASLVGNPVGGTFSGTGIIGSAFSPVAAGVGLHTVTYTYTDVNGCTNSIDQQVQVNDLPLPVITPGGVSEICAGSNLVLNAGGGYSVYNWSNSTNGQTTTITQAGSYNVIVTSDEGCSGTSAPIQVVVNQPPVVDLGNDTTICTGQVLNLNAGNNGATYLWSTTEITQSINVTTTGAFTVQVTDGNGCIGTDDVAVTVSNLLDPVIVASGPLSFCDGESVTLDGGSGYFTYLWSTGEQTSTIDVNTSGVVELQVWDQFGCGGSDEAIVSVLQLPNAVISPAGPIAVCSGDSVVLSASSNFANYDWSPNGEGTSSITVTQSGTYAVTVQDPNNGCEATSSPVQVTINISIPPTIVASGATEFCNGESVSLSVQPGPYNSYLWSTGSTTPSIVVTHTGDISVTVLDANNCLDSTLLGNPIHIEVWEPQPIAMQQGDSVVVTNGPFNQYQWYLNGGPIPGATADVYVPLVSGNYYVEAWDENGCTGTSFNVEFTFTGVFDLESLVDLELYPNPTNGTFTLQAELGINTDVTLALRDVVGREIMVPEYISGVSTIRKEFNISHLDAGVYFVQLSMPQGVVVRSVVKN